jgi:hypothetical protein
MREQRSMFVERMVDAGQWFERGVRVEYFPTEHDPHEQALEMAALGSYEVLGCVRVEADDHRWLDVRLRRLAHA